MNDCEYTLGKKYMVMGYVHGDPPVISDLSKEEPSEMAKWLEQRGYLYPESGWRMKAGVINRNRAFRTFWFYEKDVAILFKMTWGLR